MPTLMRCQMLIPSQLSAMQQFQLQCLQLCNWSLCSHGCPDMPEAAKSVSNCNLP